jgi:hypothetical protein
MKLDQIGFWSEIKLDEIAIVAKTTSGVNFTSRQQGSSDGQKMF